MVTADDILYDMIPAYLIHSRKTLVDVEAIYNDPQMTVALKKQKIAALVTD